MPTSAKPRIAVFSGPTATIQNSEPLVTSNKARHQYDLPLRTNPDGSPLRFDALRPQRLAAPVTVYIEQFSAHPLERDAAELYAPPDGYLEGGPDLAVEIRSPDDSIASQMRKIVDYFANGTKLAWLILPEEGTVLVLTPDSAPRTLVSGDNLTGGELLPGLEFPVDFLFG